MSRTTITTLRELTDLLGVALERPAEGERSLYIRAACDGNYILCEAAGNAGENYAFGFRTLRAGAMATAINLMIDAATEGNALGRTLTDEPPYGDARAKRLVALGWCPYCHAKHGGQLGHLSVGPRLTSAYQVCASCALASSDKVQAHGG